MEHLNSIIDKLKGANISHIHAGYRTYKLQFKEHIEVEGVPCWGNTCFDTGVIQVDSTLEPEAFRETLIHEMTHLFLEVVGLGGTEEEGMVASRSNEDLTIGVTRGLLILMNLNQELFRILVG